MTMPIAAGVPMIPPVHPTRQPDALVLPPAEPEPPTIWDQPYATTRKVHKGEDHTAANQLKIRHDRERGQLT